MSYTVVWTPSAEEDLAAVWVASSDRYGITTAADQIEERLRFEPLVTGEARESNVSRVVFLSPLSILFEVIEDDKRVLIRGVALIR